ncbi:MAG TPA: hypothetical protein VFK69_11185, partial [Candidatus Eisenbacteria bacterium]|nr:hypothetical protein [Candidatus Eisenbacteria bacterium]
MPHAPVRAFAAIAVMAALTALGGCAPRAARFDPDAVPEGYRRSTAALMWPGATRAFQITPEGDLYNGAWRVRIAGGPLALGTPRTIAFEDRWLPVAHWRRAQGPVRWEFEAVALPAPAPCDTGLVASVLATAVNAGAAPAPARLECTLEPADSLDDYVAFDTPAAAAPPRWSGAGSDTVHAWASAPATGATVAARWTLAPGERRTLRLVVPTYPT